VDPKKLRANVSSLKYLLSLFSEQLSYQFSFKAASKAKKPNKNLDPSFADLQVMNSSVAFFCTQNCICFCTFLCAEFAPYSLLTMSLTWNSQHFLKKHQNHPKTHFSG
jgi:hypothetical protein